MHRFRTGAWTHCGDQFRDLDAKLAHFGPVHDDAGFCQIHPIGDIQRMSTSVIWQNDAIGQFHRGPRDDAPTFAHDIIRHCRERVAGSQRQVPFAGHLFSVGIGEVFGQRARVALPFAGHARDKAVRHFAVGAIDQALGQDLSVQVFFQRKIWPGTTVIGRRLRAKAQQPCADEDSGQKDQKDDGESVHLLVYSKWAREWTVNLLSRFCRNATGALLLTAQATSRLTGFDFVRRIADSVRLSEYASGEPEFKYLFPWAIEHAKRRYDAKSKRANSEETQGD